MDAAVAAVCTHTRGHYRAGRSKQKGARKANIIKKKTLPSKAKVSLPSSFSLSSLCICLSTAAVVVVVHWPGSHSLHCK